MAVTDPGRRVLPASGTFNGNPVTAAAGVVSVEDLTDLAITAMASLAERMADGIVAAGAAVGLGIEISRIGSLLNVYIGSPPAPGPERTDGEIIALAHLAMLDHGVFVAPRGLIALSTVLDDEVADEALAGIGAALADVAAESG
jgi:glutamate-1-semialdehyde 2,1-aminomutase